MLELKEFNAIQFLPLEYLTPMVERLKLQYLTARPKDPTIIQEEPSPPTEDLAWETIPEKNKQVCPLCEEENLHLYDIDKEHNRFLTQGSMFYTILSIQYLISIPIILLLNNCSQRNESIAKLFEKHLPSLEHFLSDTGLSQDAKIIYFVTTSLLCSLIMLMLRTVLNQYIEYIKTEEAETGVHKVKYKCKSCGFDYTAEIPYSENKNEKTNKTTRFLACLIISILFFFGFIGVMDRILIILDISNAFGILNFTVIIMHVVLVLYALYNFAKEMSE